MYTHFKKAPGSKKLGVLYVVDSVTRQWYEQARKAGQNIGPSAPDGTFAAGVNHVTELLPSLMNDIISVAPDDQKVRFLDKMLCGAIGVLSRMMHVCLCKSRPALDSSCEYAGRERFSRPEHLYSVFSVGS